MKISKSLIKTLDKVKEYMAVNLLLLNPDKTKMMVLSRSQEIRNRISISARPKYINHSKHLRILGIDISYDLNWKYFLLDGKISICKQLTTRVNALKMLKQSTPTPVLKMISNGVFMSKLLYGTEA